MSKYKKICYVAPYTEGLHNKNINFPHPIYSDVVFSKKRPGICWENIYGWIDCYAVLFDPTLNSEIGGIPEFSNGAPGSIDPDAFYITCGGEATEQFHPENVPGLFLCPDNGKPERISMKERLQTPCGKFFLPVEFPYTDAEGNDPDWVLGERSILNRNKNQIELYIELFFMIEFMGYDAPQKRLLKAADFFAKLLDIPQNNSAQISEEFRLDCQSYGTNRFFMQWLLRLLGQDQEEVRSADECYLSAVRSCNAGDFKSAEDSLKAAFCELYRIRRQYIQTDLQIAEFPHAGIIFPETGFFELEWPEGSRKDLTNHLDSAEFSNYRTNFELSAGDWRHLNRMYPGMISRIKRLWNEKKVELTNGTMSLPYAFVSPLALQYYQFRTGNETFRSVFGRSPELYQCQENSFTPQMPEFLSHFGYKGVIYTAQNHGSPSREKDTHIIWESPAGLGLPAITTSDWEQSRIGFNFFLDIPLILFQHRDKKSYHAMNFMDLGYQPFRDSLARATKFAPIFGRFVCGSELLENVQAERPRKHFTSDDYNFSYDAFYGNYTNENALSHFEEIFELTSQFRTLQLLGKANPADMEEIIRTLCLLEAHDCDRVQGQRPGHFYYRRTSEPSPASKIKLSSLLVNIKKNLKDGFGSLYEEAVAQKTKSVLNPAEVPLTFAELRNGEKFDGKAFTFCGRNYLSGNFAPMKATGSAGDQSSEDFTVSRTEGVLGDWYIAVKDQNVIVRKGAKSSEFSPIDYKQGKFRCESAVYQSNETWLTARLMFVRTEPEPEMILLEGITTKDSDYLEWTVKYSGRNGFSESKRWEDFLALSFAITPETKLRNYVPAMMAETKEDKINSSCCLELVDSCSLLFSGAGNFYRQDNQLFWLLHVANESAWSRKIVISFSEKTPALLSRGVLTGLYPAEKLTEAFPDMNGALAVECQISEREWLVSNITEKDLALPSDLQFKAMDGSALNGALKPWQLAILTFA